LEEHTVSIFRAVEVTLDSGGIYTGLKKGKDEGAGQSEMKKLGTKRSRPTGSLRASDMPVFWPRS
jgi:hypothetical protein